MIGDGYWSAGITCQWIADMPSKSGGPRSPGWGVSLEFCDAGFCSDDPANGELSTEGSIGKLGTRYYVSERDANWQALRVAIDVLIGDAERMGIAFRVGGSNILPALYVPGDGEDPDVPLPEGWHETLTREAARLGWTTYDRAAPALPPKETP